MSWEGSSDSWGFETVDLDAKLGACIQQRAEQVLPGRPLTVQQVGAGAAEVVANDVGGQRRDGGPERGTVRRDAVRQVDPAALADHAPHPRSPNPTQSPPLAEATPA